LAAASLIDAGMDINLHALNGETPLHDAISLGINSVRNLLLERGANLEVRDAEGNTPLMEAVIAGYSAVVSQLLSLGAEESARNSRGDTPLHMAVSLNRRGIAEALLQIGASIHARNNLGMTPFRIALITAPDLVSLLMSQNRIILSDDFGNSPLHIAVADQIPVNILGSLLDLGARLSSVDSAGKTPLRIAVDISYWDAVKLLADAGSDPFAAAGDGKTSADVALTKGLPGINALFQGATINARDTSGNNILHIAARSAPQTLIRRLIELGANKNQLNISGETPWNVAIRWNRPDIVDLLRLN
jgi:ankyrin repeat protein